MVARREGDKGVTFSMGYLTTFQYQDYTVEVGSMTYKLERIWKEEIMAQLRYYPRMHLEGLKKPAQKTSVRKAGLLVKIETHKGIKGETERKKERMKERKEVRS
jgi:hypothetical protein